MFFCCFLLKKKIVQKNVYFCVLLTKAILKMKKTLLLSLVLTFFLAIGLKATDLKVTIESGEHPAGIIHVPVTLEFLDLTTTIGAFDLRIDIGNPAVLKKIEDIIPGPGLPVVGLTKPASGDDPFTVSWASPTSIDSSTLTNDLLLTLVFDASMGTSELNFIEVEVLPHPKSEFYSDGAGTIVIPADFNDGLITITAPVPLSSWALFISAGLFVVFMAVRGRRLF